CTGLHTLGPLTRAEARRVLVLPRPDGVRALNVVEASAPDVREMPLGAHGGCGYLEFDGRCHVHATLGARAKPAGCRRFPYRATATEDGLRISTHHRCPCRTMGERPPLDVNDAREALEGGRGHSDPDAVVTRKILLRRGKPVAFDAWKRFEGELFARAAAGERAESLIDVRSLPTLRGEPRWHGVVEDMRSAHSDGTAFDATVAWFAEGLAEVVGVPIVEPPPARPWGAAFDRAEARPAVSEAPEARWVDWLLDEVWGLEWAAVGSFQLATLDWSVRLRVGRAIERRIAALGASPVRAAAEAVCVVDTVGASGWWEDVASRLVE
ncbi:MAG: hypothetical protein KC417_16660, partial [Myxococcales bacterium]|nr:hypothetical protein [Myxococcales bacterium]